MPKHSLAFCLSGFLLIALASCGVRRETRRQTPIDDDTTATDPAPKVVGFIYPCTFEMVSNNLLYLPVSSDLTKYVQCDNFGKPTIRQCGPGTYWNPIRITCSSYADLKHDLMKAQNVYRGPSPQVLLPPPGSSTGFEDLTPPQPADLSALVQDPSGKVSQDALIRQQVDQQDAIAQQQRRLQSQQIHHQMEQQLQQMHYFKSQQGLGGPIDVSKSIGAGPGQMVDPRMAAAANMMASGYGNLPFPPPLPPQGMIFPPPPFPPMVGPGQIPQGPVGLGSKVDPTGGEATSVGTSMFSMGGPEEALYGGGPGPASGLAFGPGNGELGLPFGGGPEPAVTSLYSMGDQDPNSGDQQKRKKRQFYGGYGGYSPFGFGGYGGYGYGGIYGLGGYGGYGYPYF